ncbi:MAG: LL-diaminopimelate aminotransferase [Clostridiaceae bacterium]|nr:LL-diaminopimelate aminotransferase [Clostridiaceae bacterium]NBH77570.1 LL-diaminopimelate aminotransferase [Clostridiaceae bacterium]NBI80761.1 LL-diaminopimelate aminotransferase [Clostridiaceae bacterium]
MKLCPNFKTLEPSYLFADIAHKVSAYQAAHPDAPVIRLGIGDVTLPLAPTVVDALRKAAAEQGVKETFHGYGDEQGYGFLQSAIVDYYAQRGVTLAQNEVFISDGAKSDLGNILDIFSKDNTVLIPDPVYPVYVDTNRMDGRQILFADANEGNGFLPLPDPAVHADIIYLCSPNNPTGAAYDRAGLQAWVDYALEHHAVILYDAAYECFITDPALPRSIFELEGAKRCAIEFCSFSKMAGFTGTRCGWTAVPEALAGGEPRKMWLRRQTTKFNGVPYIVQRGAEAAFTDQGQREIHEALAYYQKNAAVLADTLTSLGIWYTGGKNSPYLWLKCPNGMESWAFFDFLLEKANLVGTPGAGFGKNGRNFFRLTAFGDQAKTAEAAERLKALLG